MRSDALPPARNCNKPISKDVAALVGFFVLAVTLPWFTACSAATSATTPSKSQTATPRTPPVVDLSPYSHFSISGDLPSAQVGTAYSGSISAGGGKSPYSFSLSWGSLPPGLSLGATTGTISGVPTKTGSFNFGVHVVDSRDNGGANAFQITVSNSSGIVVTVSPANATVASSGTQQFTASVTNTSNVGVTWAASTGTISSNGLYTAPSVKSTTNATVTATSSADTTKSGTAQVTITTGQTGLSITTTGLTSATSGVAYSAIIKATGGTTPYSWSLTSGSLPSGFSLSTGGTLSGTTTQTATFSFTVKVTDSSSPKQSASQSLSLTVNSQSGGGGKGIQLSFFGADFNSGKTWVPTDGQNQQATLGGIRLWDDGIKWGQVNTADGVYNWKSVDDWLDKAASINGDVLYTFGDTPQFAAPATAPGGCASPGPYSCAAPKDVNSDGTGTDAYFQAYVTALVNHAAGRIAYYELWNEPDCKCFFAGTEAQLVRMGKDAAAIIRSLDPNAKILSPSAHGPTMATWFDDYIAAGGAPNFDIVNVHMRGQHGTNGSPEAFLTIYGQVVSELQKRNLTSLPLWDDEHGILNTDGVTDPDELAGYVGRSLALRAGVGLQRQYVYTWDTPSTAYGLQGNEAGTAWDQVAGWLLGHTISPCTSSGTVYTCQLDNGMIVWDTAQSCSKGVCTTSNYNYPSGYVYSHDISGNRTALSGKTVGIGYQPILLDNSLQ